MIQIDLNDIAKNITPPRLRSYELEAFMKSMNASLLHLLSLFYTNEQRTRFEMSFNGQVMYIEKLLNIKFNNNGDEIYITDPEISEETYLYNFSEENEDVYVYNFSENQSPLYLYNSSEYTVNFLVYVPTGLINNWIEFRAWIDRYKLISKTYKIIEY